MKDDIEEYDCNFCNKTFYTALAAAVHEQDKCKQNPEVAD